MSTCVWEKILTLCTFEWLLTDNNNNNIQLTLSLRLLHNFSSAFCVCVYPLAVFFSWENSFYFILKLIIGLEMK